MFEKPEVVSESAQAVQQFVLFGHPVAHSRSPLIHARFAKQAGVAMAYRAVDVEPNAFGPQLEVFAASGGAGANVTLPHKAAAASHSTELGREARQAGVVNTLTRRPRGGWRGDLTDGLGLVADISERLRLDIRGRRTLLLGAGGAAQAVLGALLDAGIEQVVIAARNPQRADALADRIGEPSQVGTAYWNDLAATGAYDFVLNATSAGHRGESLDLPFSLLHPRTLVYDMNYGAASIDFLAWAKTAGCTYRYDGLGMLVEQAAESFYLWHDVRPETDPVYDELRAQLGTH